MINQDLFLPTLPRRLPRKEECSFYHVMDCKDGTHIDGAWDIRGRFPEYIGEYPIQGKSLLDVGTASGFLTFAAEDHGATVTAIEAAHASEYAKLHFSGQAFHENREQHDKDLQTWLETLKNSFWYAWHKNASRADMVYAPLALLPYWDRKFDIVLAGAILEHLSDPVLAVWSMTQLAREAVIIAFTPVAHDDNQYMITANTWEDPAFNYTWWTLSTGLFKRIFANVGFSTEFVTATALLDGVKHTRTTIIGRRIK